MIDYKVVRRIDQANKGTGWMPMALIAEEGRGKLRKAMGSRKRALIHGYPNGETRPVEDRSPADEFIVCTEGTRGTETSKYPEEKKERSIPPVAASEEGKGQTIRLRRDGVADHQREAKREPNTEGKRDQRR